jgi:hypothetical protein
LADVGLRSATHGLGSVVSEYRNSASKLYQSHYNLLIFWCRLNTRKVRLPLLPDGKTERFMPLRQAEHWRLRLGAAIIARVDGANGTDSIEALLRAAPTGPLPAPPIDTKAQVLPIGDLEWPNAERLFLRLLRTIHQVQYSKLFGVPGQPQAGVDVYARLSRKSTDSAADGRDYITLQSRRVESLTAGQIKKAVDDFLEGEWAGRTSTFYFATAFDLRDVKLDFVIREQAERLARFKIDFVPWGVQEVSSLLKDHPRIVVDFFGQAWGERFCGAEAARRAPAASVPGRSVPAGGGQASSEEHVLEELVPAVPQLDSWVVDRPDEVTQIVNALESEAGGTVRITTAVRGAGGFGKTTLARMVHVDQRVLDLFGNRVYWVTLGRDAGREALAGLVNGLITRVAPSRAVTFTDALQAAEHLAAILSQGPPRLLIIDDVWNEEQLAAFPVAGRCARLVTTRSLSLTADRAISVRVDQMTDGQARALLLQGLPPLPPGVVKGLLKETGCWPLLLRLVNKIL